MKDTRIVFIGIAVLALLPILFQGVKNIWYTAKGHNVKHLWIRLLGVLLAASAVILLVVSLYRFTIGYQAPLVAEQFHQMFVNRIDKTNSEVEYLNSLEKKGLIVPDFIFVKDEDIDSSDLNSGEYSVALSENIYDNDDGTIIIYARYQKDDYEVYTSLKLDNNNNKWKAVEHRILTENELDNADLNKRFYEIEVGS